MDVIQNQFFSLLIGKFLFPIFFGISFIINAIGTFKQAEKESENVDTQWHILILAAIAKNCTIDLICMILSTTMPVWIIMPLSTVLSIIYNVLMKHWKDARLDLQDLSFYVSAIIFSSLLGFVVHFIPINLPFTGYGLLNNQVNIFMAKGLRFFVSPIIDVFLIEQTDSWEEVMSKYESGIEGFINGPYYWIIKPFKEY